MDSCLGFSSYCMEVRRYTFSFCEGVRRKLLVDAVWSMDNSCVGDIRMATNKIVTRQAAIRYTDKWFSLYIRAKGNNICFTCGTRDAVMQCGHLFSRVSFATRWNEKNAECQCAGCNMYHEHNPHRFTIAYIGKYGLDQYELMNILHSKPFKITTKEIILLGDDFKRKYKEIINGRNS